MANLEIVMDETTVELAVISGAQQSDITSAVNAHSALATGVHGVGASTVSSAADVSVAVAAHNALATAHGLTANISAALSGAEIPSVSNVLMTNSAVMSIDGDFSEDQFSPLSVANLVIWLDASQQGLTDLTAVDTAYDSSGSGNHFTQATGIRQPIYHAATSTTPAYFDFDGSNDYLRTATPTLTQPTVAFMVARFKAEYTAADTMMDGGGGANTFRVYRTAPRETVFYAGGNIFLDYTAESSWQLYTIVANAASSVFTIENITLAGSGATNAAGITIGANGVGTPNQYAACQIAALAIYSRALSSEEIAKLQQYFRMRYLATRLVFVGDSITHGTAATGAVGFSALTWLNKLKSSVDLGVGGTTIVQMLAKASYESFAWKRVNRTLNTVVIMGGTNDIATGATGAATYANLVKLCAIWRSVGWRVVVVTMLPRTGTDAERASYNTLIRNNYATFADGLADAGGDALMGQNGQNTDTTYYNVDTVHPNDTGHARISTYVIAAITWL